MDKRKRNNELVRIEEAYEKLAVPKHLDPVQQAVWMILARSSSSADATKAWNAICKDCIDVNEIRVSKATDLARAIEKYVKGDAVDTATEVRGFLRRIFLDHFRVDFEFSKDLDREAIRKYLVDRPDSGREVAMGLALQTWRDWYREAEPAEGEDGAAKAKKPTERELDAFAMKMRMLLTVATLGRVTAKSKQATNPAKPFLNRWSPESGSVARVLAAREVRKKEAKKIEKPAPPKIIIPPPAPPKARAGRRFAQKAPAAAKIAKMVPTKTAVKKTPKKTVKKAAKKATKTVAKKAPAKKRVVRKTAAARRTKRPRTSRVRPRTAAKKSSRR